MLAMIIGLGIGFGLPVQTAINSRLRHVVGSPLRSSMISFSVGTLFLALLLLVSMQGLLISQAVVGSQPWWIWTGGILGVIYLTGNIVLFPHLGAAQTVIMPIVGQLIMSMLIDNFGWFSAPQHALTPIRIIGALVVLAGVVLTVATTSVTHELTPSSTPAKTGLIAWQIAGIATGMLSAMQTAINGHLGSVLHSPEQAAFVSFLVGTLVLWLIVAVHDRGIHIASAFSRTNPWWIWIGGIIGAIFVLGNAFLVPKIGTGLTVVIVLFGMISAGLIIDSFGWLGAKRIPPRAMQLIGIVTLIIGVVMIKLF